MNSNEQQQQHINSELILKTEEYDCPDGRKQLSPYQSVPQPVPSVSYNSTPLRSQSRTQPLTSVNSLVISNNNIAVSSQVKVPSTNSDSFCLTPPKSEISSSFDQTSTSGHQDRMPIAAPVEMQTSSTAGTTPGQHSISPSLPPQSTNGQNSSGGTGNPADGEHSLTNNRRMTSILGGYGLLGPLDHYRLQLYSYAMNVERLRSSPHQQLYSGPLYTSGYPSQPGMPSVGNGPYAPTRFALSMGLFPNRMFQPEEPKPQHSYIGLIAMAILSSQESKLVLSDIYQYILDNYPYFRSRGPGWRNSIRHNLSLNDCFIKAGRSANGKGHYWAVHPANLDDFRKGDFRRRKAQRKVRKHMGLAVDDEGTDSPSPPPLAITPPPMAPPTHPGVLLVGNNPYVNVHHPNHQHYANPLSTVIISGRGSETVQTTTTAGVFANLYSQSRKRQFDVASLLAPDDSSDLNRSHHHHHLVSQHQQSLYKNNHNHHLPLTNKQRLVLNEDEDIDVVASDVDEEQVHENENENNLRIDRRQLCMNIHPSPPCDNNHYHHQRSNNQDKDGENDSPSPLSFSPPLDLNNQQMFHHQNSTSPQHSQQSRDPATAAGSVIPVDDIRSNNNNQNSTAPINNNWQGLMQHWPNELGTAAAAAAAAATMDPRIFGRYYSQYMAAAAARRVAGVFPTAAAVAAAAVIGHQNNNSANKQQLNAVVAQQHSTTLQQQKLQQQQQSYEC